MPFVAYKVVFKVFKKDKIDFQDFINDDNTKILIGKNYDLYHEIWLQNYQKFKGERKKVEVKGRWNWLAFLFIPAWWGYRKIHTYFWTVTLLVGALIFVESFVDKTFVKSMSGMYILLALYSRSSYLLHILNLSKKYKKLPNTERREKFLKIHTGVSKVWAWGYGVGYIAILIAASVSGQYFGGHL